MIKAISSAHETKGIVPLKVKGYVNSVKKNVNNVLVAVKKLQEYEEPIPNSVWAEVEKEILTSSAGNPLLSLHEVRAYL